MKYKAIIFDMDGTIIDTNPLWRAANRALLKKRGIVLSPEIEHELFMKIDGLTITQTCTQIKEFTQLTDPLEIIIQEKLQIVCGLYKEQIKFMDGFTDFHKKVQSYNLKTGVATNADDHTLTIAKKALNLERFFGKHIYNISYVNNKGKPDPDVYLHAAAQLNVPPEQCIAIEDSAHGIQAAKSAGLFCIGFNSSNHFAHVQHSHYIVNRYDEIDLARLLELNAS